MASFITGPNVVSVIVSLGFFLTLGAFLTRPINLTEAGWTALNIMLGGLTVQFANVVMFQIGSTRSSKEKDETIQKQASTISKSDDTIKAQADTIAKGP